VTDVGVRSAFGEFRVVVVDWVAVGGMGGVGLIGLSYFFRLLV